MAVNPQWLAKVLRGAADTDTHRECRHCGTTVDDSVDTCPTCGATEIASYRLTG